MDQRYNQLYEIFKQTISSKLSSINTLKTLTHYFYIFFLSFTKMVNENKKYVYESIEKNPNLAISLLLCLLSTFLVLFMWNVAKTIFKTFVFLIKTLVVLGFVGLMYFVYEVAMDSID